jgi:hypothetical protein
VAFEERRRHRRDVERCQDSPRATGHLTGYSDLAKLALAVERDLAAQRPTIRTTTKEDTLIAVTV